MFAVFDKNEDGYIDRDEFQFCWNNWIKTVNRFLSHVYFFFHLIIFLKIVRPVSAFLVVDVQNDFISGSLNISNCSAQQNGLEVKMCVCVCDCAIMHVVNLFQGYLDT